MWVSRRLVNYEAVVYHHAPGEPVREVSDVARIPLGETLLDGLFLGIVKLLDVVKRAYGLDSAVHLGQRQAEGWVVEIVAMLPPVLRRFRTEVTRSVVG